MYYPADRNEHAAILGDLAVYGNHAPHLRYRQERIRSQLASATAAAATTAESQAAHEIAPRLTLRERIGSRLIAWGQRLEGCPNPSIAHPA